MSVADSLKQKLTEAFSPTHLEVVDESHKHKGHVGARPEGETHFHVTIESQAFSGMTRVMQQRLIYQAVQEELDGPVHALGLTVRVPKG